MRRASAMPAGKAGAQVSRQHTAGPDGFQHSVSMNFLKQGRGELPHLTGLCPVSVMNASLVLNSHSVWSH